MPLVASARGGTHGLEANDRRSAGGVVLVILGLMVAAICQKKTA
jgi:hypothetical protein